MLFYKVPDSVPDIMNHVDILTPAFVNGIW